MKKCETVIISDKAYNAMIRESFAKHPVETGGILLGYILDNGMWVVMEMIPPGINGVFQTAYFEYDQDFVNYLGTSVANQYKEPLQVLGLWHRHPGSMDYFSTTDDGTNSEFASKNPYGVISGIVNIDPSFRLTMYHLDHNDGVRPKNIAYSTVGVEVGDDLIPEKFFALRYVDGENRELHPSPTHTNTIISQTHEVPKSTRNGGVESEIDLIDEKSNGEKSDVADVKLEQPSAEEKLHSAGKKEETSAGKQKLKLQHWLFPVITFIFFILGIFIGVKIAPYLSILEAKESVEETVDATLPPITEEIVENPEVNVVNPEDIENQEDNQIFSEEDSISGTIQSVPES